MLISNVSDYVGLGSLRFFIQTKKEEEEEEERRGEERSGRGKRPGSLPRDCPIRRPSSFVSFSSGLSVRPRVSRRAVLHFEALFAFYYFILFRILRSPKSRTATTLTRCTSRNGFAITIQFPTRFERS